MTEREVPKQVGGYTVMGGKSLRLGVFGTDYLGHSNEGLRLLKVLREGEGLAVSEEAYAALEGDAAVLHFGAGQAVGQDQRVLTSHTVQAAAFGVVVGGSPLQNECVETTREFDDEQRCASLLRNATLVQKAQLLRQLAEVVARFHEEGKQFPYLSPWNVLLEGDSPRIAEVGLGLRPDDPKFKADEVPEDVLVFLAPEVLRAIREGTVVQVSTPADVYALAATARAVLLNRVPDPAGPKGGEGPSRRERILAGQGLDLSPHQVYSRELESLLARALSADPQKRPSAQEIAVGLGRLIEGERIAYTPPAEWPKYVAIGVGAVLLILLVIFLIPRPPEGLTVARESYAQATRTDDLAEQQRLLEAATYEGADGTSVTLPEARRLLAINAYHRWVAARAAAAGEGEGEGPAAGELGGILDQLERDVVQPGEDDDELSKSARFLVGFLRRWELGGAAAPEDGGEEAAARPGDALLESLEGDLLRGPLAESALAMTAAGAAEPLDEDDLKAWSEAASAALRDDGFLTRDYPSPSYEDDLDVETKPAGVSLDSLWIAQLLMGRLQHERSAPDDAGAKLLQAWEAVPCFATRTALGLHLAEHGSGPAGAPPARELIEASLGEREFAEGHLALARLALASAHETGDPAAYDEAAELFQAARAAVAETPGLDVAGEVARLENETEFFALMTRAATALEEGRDEALAAVEKDLGAFIAEVTGDPALADRFGPDSYVTRGLVRLARSDAVTAAGDLLHLFQREDVAEGWRELPDFAVAPPTRRDRTEYGQAVHEALVQRVEAGLAELPEERRERRDALKQLDGLLEQAQTLAGSVPGVGALGSLLARGKVELARLLGSDAGNTDWREALASARAAFDAALEEVTAADFDVYTEALAGQLEVLGERIAAVEPDELAEAAREVEDILETRLEAKPTGLDRQDEERWEAFQAEQRRELRSAFGRALERFVERRRQDWDEVDLAAPEDYSEAKEDAAVLEQAIDLHGEEPAAADKPAAARLRLDVARVYVAQRLYPKALEHARRAFELLDEAGVEPTGATDAAILMREAYYVAGFLALFHGDQVRNLLGDRAADDGKEWLAKAAKADGYADLVRRLGQPGFVPEPKPAAALARWIVAQRDGGAGGVDRATALGSLRASDRDVRQAEEDLELAARIDPRSATARLLAAVLELGTGEPEKLREAAEHAKAAYRLAKERRAARGDDRAAAHADQVQAARIYLYATAEARPDEVVKPDFRRIAEEGGDAAEELFSADSTARSQSYNYGPAYWLAFHHLQRGFELLDRGDDAPAKEAFEEAEQAYDAFEGLLKAGVQRERAAPAEAAKWRDERNTARELASTIR